MLRIRRDLVDAMVAHARRDHPDEACGVLAGPTGSDRPERFIEMTNAERSPTYHSFDSREILELENELESQGEDRIVLYHSHTSTEAYPSPTDIEFASDFGYPDAHYVLISTRYPDTHELCSYRIVDRVVTKEQVEVVESYV